MSDQICLKPLKELDRLDIHHVIPRSKKGLDSINNLTSVCQKCHCCLIELTKTPLINYKSTTKTTLKISYRIIRVKIFSPDPDKTLTEIIIEALSEYLKKWDRKI